MRFCTHRALERSNAWVRRVCLHSEGVLVIRESGVGSRGPTHLPTQPGRFGGAHGRDGGRRSTGGRTGIPPRCPPARPRPWSDTPQRPQEAIDMHVLPRRLGLLLAGSAAAAALAVPIAGQADAATSVVRLHTQANTGHFLSNVSVSAFIAVRVLSDDRSAGSRPTRSRLRRVPQLPGPVGLPRPPAAHQRRLADRQVPLRPRLQRLDEPAVEDQPQRRLPAALERPHRPGRPGERQPGRQAGPDPARSAPARAEVAHPRRLTRPQRARAKPLVSRRVTRPRWQGVAHGDSAPARPIPDDTASGERERA